MQGCTSPIITLLYSLLIVRITFSFDKRHPISDRESTASRPRGLKCSTKAHASHASRPDSFLGAFSSTTESIHIDSQKASPSLIVVPSCVLQHLELVLLSEMIHPMPAS